MEVLVEFAAWAASVWPEFAACPTCPNRRACAESDDACEYATRELEDFEAFDDELLADCRAALVLATRYRKRRFPRDWEPEVVELVTLAQAVEARSRATRKARGAKG